MKQGRGFFLGTLAGAVLPTLLLVLLLWKPQCSRTSGPIAVLRFEASGPEVESLSYGVGSAISTGLTQAGLNVLPWLRTGSAEPESDLAIIAEEMGARCVLKGTVSVREDSIRVKAVLADVSGRALWSGSRAAPRSADRTFVECHLAQAIAREVIGVLGDTDDESPPKDARSVFVEAVKIVDEDNERAEDLLREVLCLDPGYTDAYVALATVYFRRPGKEWVDEAIRNYETALDLEPGLVNARRGLVNSYWQLGKFEDCLRQVVGIPSGVAELDRLLLRGEAYCKCGLPDLGVPEIEKVLELDPDNEAALWMLVYGYLGIGDGRKTVDTGLKYLGRFDPEDYWVRMWLGGGYRLLGEADSALALLEATTDESRGTGNLVNGTRLAASYLQRGQEDRAVALLTWAREAIRKRLRHTPFDLELKSLLAIAQAFLGETEEARELTDQIVASPGNGKVLWELGCRLAGAGEESKGMEALWQALSSGCNYYMNYLGPGRMGLELFGASSLADHPGFLEFERACLADLERLRRTYR